MKYANKTEFNLNQSSPREYDLKKFLTGCGTCLREAIKNDRQINKRSLNEEFDRRRDDRPSRVSTQWPCGARFCA